MIKILSKKQYEHMLDYEQQLNDCLTEWQEECEDLRTRLCVLEGCYSKEQDRNAELVDEVARLKDAYQRWHDFKRHPEDIPVAAKQFTDKSNTLSLVANVIYLRDGFVTMTTGMAINGKLCFSGYLFDDPEEPEEIPNVIAWRYIAIPKLERMNANEHESEA